MDMQTTINRNLLQYAVGRQITCRRCDSHHILDMRDAVLVTLKGREHLLCGPQYDAIKLAIADTATNSGWTLEVIDGRELFPRPRRAARRVR